MIDVAAVVAPTNARGHQVVAGKLDRDRLGFAERAVLIALRSPQGDLRDWAGIGAWTAATATEGGARARALPANPPTRLESDPSIVGPPAALRSS